jgi:predicted adenine nucleotide alpha hydrolase (AANH) superfamily ATPase
MDALLLHICCGPCSTVPLGLLAEGQTSFATLFYNPNIQPAEEYEHRRVTFCSFAKNLGVKASTGPYDPESWEAAIAEYAGVFPLVKGSSDFAEMRERRVARCRACYAHRFAYLAASAKEGGFSTIATTLSISPWQFIDVMEQEFLAAACRAGLTSAFCDYREQYPESVRRSRELGMYRQNYCGCHYSQTEAALERSARKTTRGETHV